MKTKQHDLDDGCSKPNMLLFFCYLIIRKVAGQCDDEVEVLCLTFTGRGGYSDLTAGQNTAHQPDSNTVLLMAASWPPIPKTGRLTLRRIPPRACLPPVTPAPIQPINYADLICGRGLALVYS